MRLSGFKMLAEASFMHCRLQHARRIQASSPKAASTYVRWTPSLLMRPVYYKFLTSTFKGYVTSQGARLSIFFSQTRFFSQLFIDILQLLIRFLQSKLQRIRRFLHQNYVYSIFAVWNRNLNFRHLRKWLKMSDQWGTLTKT